MAIKLRRDVFDAGFIANWIDMKQKEFMRDRRRGALNSQIKLDDEKI